MIPRYALPDMTAVWSDTTRFGRWLEIELLATDAHAAAGVVPADAAASCRAKAPTVDEAFVAAVAEREQTTDHDVAAFVDVVQAAIGMPAGSWVHHGLTSSDVVDTALCWAMRDAGVLLVSAATTLIDTTVTLARRHRHSVMTGRTHGIHAEPTTFGSKVALWALALDRDRTRLRTAVHTVSVGKLSGAVGTYSNIDPDIERYVTTAIGLRPVPATQVINRDRHAELLWACASTAATCEMIAVELRHLQRTEVAEVLEGFRPGQKGSSAMPHKRNPISAETVSGLARVVRSNLLAGLQDVALWHERDITHSSVERIILPDSTLLVHYCLHRLHRLLANLTVDTERMRENLWSSRGLLFSQPVLLGLVAQGMARDEAYRIVQRNAMRSWEERMDFRALLEADPAMALDRSALDQAFDLDRSLRHVDRVFEELDPL